MTTNWTIDTAHSEIQFKAKHLVISTVTGKFTRFSATLESNGDDFAGAKVGFEADVNSISTGVEQRDGHLMSEEFFNAEKYPKLTFTSTDFQKTGDNTYAVTGNMTIRDITRTVVLAVEYGGKMVDFYGNTKAGFEITGKINRKEFGLTWDAVTEAGGIVVGDEIKLALNVQMAAN